MTTHTVYLISETTPDGERYKRVTCPTPAGVLHAVAHLDDARRSSLHIETREFSDRAFRALWPALEC